MPAGFGLIVAFVGCRLSGAGSGLLNLVGRLPRWSRPTVVALALALVSWPFVTLMLVTMALGPTTVDANGAPLLSPPPVAPASPLAQWAGAAGAVFLSALVAGTVGGRVVKRNGVRGGLLTFVVALVVAIPATPLLPAILGQQVGFGCTSGIFGGTTCGYAVATNNLVDGVMSDAFFWLAPIVAPGPVLTLALGVAAWTAIVRRLTPDNEAKPSPSRVPPMGDRPR